MIFYSGVVEDRFDPLTLGRCKVRIVGLHTEDKKILPTESLPWAYPLQPITSAAMSGIGHSPVGPVEGTWVMIIFRDQEQQIPVMIGTLGGIPQSKEKNSLYLNDDDTVLLNNESAEDIRSLDGTVALDSDGNPIVGGDSNPVSTGSGSTLPTNQPTTNVDEEYIGPLTREDIDKYKISIANLETQSSVGGEVNYNSLGVVGGQNYGVVNAYGNLGKYQLSGYSLFVLGYVSSVLNSSSERTFPSNFKLVDETIWQNKEGVKNVADFLSSLQAQESAMDEYTRYNYKQLKALGIINDSMPKKEILGYLSIAHPEGHRRVVSFKNNTDIQDGYGNTSTERYQVGYSSLEGDQPKTLPQNVPVGADASEPAIGEQKPDGTISTGTSVSGQSGQGFKDPNFKYPLKNHLNEPDTNRLARNQFIEKTTVALKDATKELKVPTAISNSTWNQPDSPYNARYPFNHVYQGESGHLMEFDDTPENERIHIYHTKGTFTEVDVNGTQVNKIVGDGYEIVDRNGYLYVKGAYNVTVDGTTKIYCRSAADIEIIGDARVYCRNDVDMEVSGSMNLAVNETLNIRCRTFHMRVLDNSTTYVNNKFGLVVGGNMDVRCDSNLSMESVGNMNVYSGSNLSLASELSTNIHASNQLNLTSMTETNHYTEGEAKYYSTGILHVRGSSGLRMRGGNFVQLTSGGNVRIDGTNTFLQSGGNVAASSSGIAAIASKSSVITFAKIDDAGERITPVNSFFETLSTPPRNISKSQYFETEDDGNPETYIKREQDAGRINPAEKPVAVETTPADPPKLDSKPVSCAGFANFTEFPLSTKLSDNFFLGDFLPGGGTGYICTSSSPHKLQDQAGLTKAEIVCNLKGLAVNVLENLIKIVPKSEFIITSGYRQLGLVGAESKTSQHPKGQACDIVLKKTPRDRKKHYDLINQMRSTIPHDQLLLEYLASGAVWIHVSWTSSCRSQCFTMNNHARVSNFGEFNLIV